MVNQIANGSTGQLKPSLMKFTDQKTAAPQIANFGQQNLRQAEFQQRSVQFSQPNFPEHEGVANVSAVFPQHDKRDAMKMEFRSGGQN